MADAVHSMISATTAAAAAADSQAAAVVAATVGLDAHYSKGGDSSSGVHDRND